jgi:hypothetical protein
MKRGILVATLMMTAAGVASANLLTTAPQGLASSWPPAQRATDAPRMVATTVNEKTATAPAPTVPSVAKAAPAAAPTAAAPTVQKASVEARQAPVPFQMRPRSPVNLPPVADKGGAEAKATDKPGETPSNPAAGDTAGQSAARAAIEADGYKGVKVLRKGVDGVWHASAMRGTATVMLTVNASGSVAAD